MKYTSLLIPVLLLAACSPTAIPQNTEGPTDLQPAENSTLHTLTEIPTQFSQIPNPTETSWMNDLMTQSVAKQLLKDLQDCSTKEDNVTWECPFNFNEIAYRLGVDRVELSLRSDTRGIQISEVFAKPGIAHRTARLDLPIKPTNPVGGTLIDFLNMDGTTVLRFFAEENTVQTNPNTGRLERTFKITFKNRDGKFVQQIFPEGYDMLRYLQDITSTDLYNPDLNIIITGTNYEESPIQP